MKLQHRINTTVSANWYRCQKVVFDGGDAIWELSRTGKYDLIGAYERKPHRQLIEAVDDDSLRAFVRAWGPLAHIRPTAWNGRTPVVAYRHERDTLAAWTRLIAEIQDSGNVRKAVGDLLRLDSEPYVIHVRQLVGAMVHQGAVLDDELEGRIADASESEIQAVCSFLVGAFPISGIPAFQLHSNRNGYEVRATLGIYSLVPALYWMVWQDIFRKEPLRFCEECSHIIPQTSRHERKFCSTECARRKTVREWQRRKRAKEKTRNGSGKTR
jgi:hypothetical protein